MQPYFTNIDINIFVIFKDIKGNGVKFKRERKKGRKKENLTLSKRSWSLRATCYMILFLANVWNRRIYTDRREISGGPGPGGGPTAKGCLSE